MISRRKFLRRSGTVATGLSLAKVALARGFAEDDAKLLDPSKLERFVDPLPILPTIHSGPSRPDPTDSSHRIPYYHVTVEEIEAKLHRDLPPTRMWGFNGSSPGPVFDTRGGKGVLVEWVNKLPRRHLLPVDYTLQGAERDKPEGRCVIHLHGGRTPAGSDGYPEEWLAPGKSVMYHYPNRQDAAMLCYHDQTIGMSRLNVYAGLQGLFLIRDESETALNLPKGKYEIPLLVYDRSLRTDGQLHYPVSADREHPWLPEVRGNAVLVNGKIAPYLDVEASRYRWRISNGSNAQKFQFSIGDGNSMYVIGSDQGLLASPLKATQVILAPGERTDLIFDFTEFSGRKLLLKSGDTDVMQFRVKPSSGRDDSVLPPSLQPMRRLRETDAVKLRRLTLDRMTLNQTPWSAPVTEKPVLGTTEVWELVNVTARDHPVQLHGVRFQVMNRHAIDLALYKENGQLRYVGPGISPYPEELGWKDTVRCDAGQATRIIVPFESYAGKYVWHSHLLEYQDNEMRRPYEVVAST